MQAKIQLEFRRIIYILYKFVYCIPINPNAYATQLVFSSHTNSARLFSVYPLFRKHNHKEITILELSAIWHWPSIQV